MIIGNTEIVFEVVVDDLVEGTFDDREAAEAFMSGLYSGTEHITLVQSKRRTLITINPERQGAKPWRPKSER